MPAAKNPATESLQRNGILVPVILYPTETIPEEIKL